MNRYGLDANIHIFYFKERPHHEAMRKPSSNQMSFDLAYKTACLIERDTGMFIENMSPPGFVKILLLLLKPHSKVQN